MTEYTGDLMDYSFLKDLIERSIRQGLQVLGPILAVVAASGEGFQFGPTALAVAAAILVTLLKGISPLQPPVGAPLLRNIVDRVGAAVAGTLLSFLSVDGLNLLTVDWSKAGYACLASAGLALVTYFGAPPARGKK